MRSALDTFVAELQGQGWRGLQKHHVLEHLLRPLLTEDGKARSVEQLQASAPE